MKKLLTKTLRAFTIYSLAVLAASVPAYYYLVDSIWLRELDEHNEIIADRIENELNRLRLTEAELARSIELWNKIQPGTNLEAVRPAAHLPDSVYTIMRPNPYAGDDTKDRFRGLSKLIRVNGHPYRLTVETNVEETEETVLAIAAITFFFFLVLVVGFLILNRRLSAQLWRPFRSTLARLKAFHLNQQAPVRFDRSDTLEFEELNTALDKLLGHSISVYKTQKEFTENASHELQTPLAIIKNKLDLLLQKEPLTGRQYEIIEEINRALTRITRINRNLLLLARMENHQFDDNETVDISILTGQCLEQLKEHSDNKGIHVGTVLEQHVTTQGNKGLIEILINNLLLNAIRHNRPGGTIDVFLSKEELSVSNSGGEALDDAAMFKRFAKTSHEHAGSGLGLAIIKQVCNRHDWTISYLYEESLHHFSIRFRTTIH